jgi:hypothetical protein
MRETRLGESEKLQVILLLSSLVIREAAQAAEVRGAADARGGAMEAALTRDGRYWPGCPTPSAFLQSRRCFYRASWEEPDAPNAEFSFGLGRLLDGVGVLAAATARGRGRDVNVLSS